MTVMSEGWPLKSKYIKKGSPRGAFQAFSHTATSSYHVCHEFNHLKLFESYSLMIYGYAMV